MKHNLKTRLLSLLLCVSMMVSLLAHVTPVHSADETDTTTEEMQNTFESNVGKQAIFDWWSDFLLIDEETLKNSTSEELFDYYSADDYANWVLYDDIPAGDLILKIIDYFYDEENGDHWYKVGARDGETLPTVLQEKPWVYYANDVDFEEDQDPYLAIYDKNDTIRFVNASLNGTDNVRFVLSSASDTLADATITITDYDGDYTVSSLAYIYEGNVAWSNAHQVQITKANGEAWSSIDGSVGISYTSANVAVDTYEDDACYAAAFLYVGETVYSAAVTDKMGYDASDIVYTNTGSSVIVYEFLDPSFEWVNETGYFTNDAVNMYDNSLANAKAYLAAELPTTFTVGYSFTDANATEWYWLVSDELIGSPYFLVRAESVTLGELPEEFGDGRVSIADEDGNAVTTITLPQYQKPEFTAVSSFSALSAGVAYQWQLEYESGKWVDIYGEDEATIKLSYGMIATLLDANGSVNIRCESVMGSGTSYSPVIPVTVDMYIPKEPDVVVSESFTSSTGEIVTVTVSGNIPDDATIALEETDSTGIEVESGETVVAALDISIKNADGTEWQPESGETVTVTLEASSLGLNEGDSFVVYHLHKGEVKILGTYVVENNTVTFDVDGFSKFVFALAAEEVETPDFSYEVGKHATLTRADGYISVLVLDAEPTVDNIYDTLAFETADFPTDIVFSIDAYKVINEYYDITDSTTNEVIGQGLTQWLWYQVSVVSGTMPEDFENNYWIFQNYLTEADAIEVDTLTLYTPEEESTEPSVNVTVDGASVTEVTIDKNATVSVVATSTLPSADIDYVWQIMIPGADMWVDISGETSPEIDVYYGKVATMLDSNGVAYIRCVTTAGTQSVTSDTIAVTFAQTYFRRVRSRVYNAMTTAEGETNTSKTYTITINYVYGNNTNKIVDDPTVIELGENDSYNDTVMFPVKQGYLAYIQPADGSLNTTTASTGVPVNVSNPTANMTVYVYYFPTNVEYKIEYYKQNIDNDEYTKVAELTAIGLAESLAIMPGEAGYNGDELTVDFSGFYELKYNIPDIAAAGNTVIQVYYNRYYYLMTFDMNGDNAYGVQPVYARYETPIEIGTPVNPGYTFVGWDDVTSGAGDGIQDTLADTMPVGGKKYKAIWKAADLAKVTVVYWGENANDTEYSYYGSQDIYVKPGDTLTYTGTGNTLICGLTPHTHGEDCTYKCELEAHSHSLENGCYKLKCTTAEHTAHTDNCYKDEIHEHGTDCYSGVGSEFSLSLNKEHYVKGNQTNGSIGESYFNYIMGESATGIKYIYINGTWYKYTGTEVTGGTATTTCGKTEHTAHTDACLTCGGLHTHTLENNCYTLTCTKTPHTHVDTCYSCIQHTHEDACYLRVTTKLSDSNLWVLNTEKTQSVTVAADGTTILGVYYDRTEFTMTFMNKAGTSAIKTLTEKWGADIKADFESVSKENTFFWAKRANGTNGEGPWTSFMDVMPAENRTYYADPQSGSTKINAYYKVESLDGSGYKTLYTVTFQGSSTIKVSKEDFEDIEGFTFNESESTKDGDYYNGAEFCYDRNRYSLNFVSGTTTVRTESVLFEAPLSTYADYTNPPFPSDLYEEGSRVFAGWYLDPDCSGEKFDLSKHNMPADNLVLYAKWEPVTYTVKVWTLRNPDGTYVGTNADANKPLRSQSGVPHGTKIQGMTIPEAPELANGRYSFDGWFYINEKTGKEEPWSFEMQVKQDLDIYAKWIADELIKYDVSYWYVDDNGNKIKEIADRTTGSNLAGMTETFYAKGDADLYEGFREGYFPTITSTSIVLAINADEGIMYVEFHYIQHDPVPYTVKYLLKNADGSTAELFESVTYSENKKAVVTENAKMKAGYKVDEPQKSLVIDISDGAINEIIFYYEVDETASFYDVTHYIKKYNSEEWEVYRFNQYNAKIDGTASSSQLTIPGYTFKETTSDGKVSVTSGIVTKDGLHLVFYYEENVITVNYKPIDSNDIVASSESGTITTKVETTGVVNGTMQGSTATAKLGYEFVGWYSDSQCTQKISSDAEFVPERNAEGLYESAIYYAKFEEIRVVINYVVVGPDGCGVVTPSAETLGAATGVAKGSIATPSSSVYKFVGWYSDEDCENLLRTDATYVPTKTDGTIWKDGTTYYAKFEYNLTSLTIKKAGYSEYATIDPNQTFVFNVKGETDGVNLTVTIHGDGEITIDGLTVGNKYTVTEKTDWSWRYEYKSCTFEGGSSANVTNGAKVTLGADAAKNVITFTNERNKDQWLDGDSYKVNIFNGTTESQE